MAYYIYKRGGEVVGYNITDSELPPPALKITGEEARALGLYVPPAGPAIEDLREAKRQELGEACSAAIYAGIDLEGSRYSLTEHDQMELMAQYDTVKEGAAAVPYHADGELCRMYPAEEFSALARAASAHVFYHRTYCNHLNAWVRRAGPEELDGIAYGAALPADLAESMAAILEAAGGAGDAV